MTYHNFGVNVSGWGYLYMLKKMNFLVDRKKEALILYSEYQELKKDN